MRLACLCIGHQLLGIVEAGQITDLGHQRRGADQPDAAQDLKIADQRRETPCIYRFAQRRLEPSNPRLRLQHPLLHLLERQLLMGEVEPLFGQPSPIDLRPGRLAAETTIVPQQEATHGLFGPRGIFLCTASGADQITHRLDIGVPPASSPMDFYAWFEVYLDGRWHAYDARHCIPRIERVLMAVGRDAADTALTIAFGWARLMRFEVFTDELSKRSSRTVGRHAPLVSHNGILGLMAVQ